MRIALALILVVHGLIHVLGFVKAYGLAELPQLTQSISRPMGVAWLAAGLLLILTALMPWRVFWLLGIFAILASQFVIATAWSDAKLGTIPNVVALLAVVYAFAARGPLSLHAEYEADVARALRDAPAAAIVTEADLAPLPAPVQRYLRASGAVGQPRPTSFHAHVRGRIRGGETEPWMPFSAVQVNTFGPSPSRMFLMDATMKRLPVAVYHRFVGDAATFRVRLLAMFQIVDAHGPEMDRSETVTLFNDLCIFAPGALVDPSIRWEPIDDRAARATFTRGREQISAELVFDASGMLVDFVSDDRARASSDGRSFTRLRWSTPVRSPRTFGPVRLMAEGEARWHEPGKRDFAYLELAITEVLYNIQTP